MVEALHGDLVRQHLSENSRQEVLLRAEALDSSLCNLTGFEDDYTKRLILSKQFLRQGKYSSLKPLLPLLLQLKGHPYSLHNYFPYEPFFRTKMPLASIFKCARQTSKCGVFDDEVLRLSSGRQVTVSELKIGDSLLSLNKDLTFSPAKVTNIFSTGTKQVLHIRTRLGAEFEVTPDHRLKTFNCYSRVSKLKIGDRLAGVRRGGEFSNNRFPSDRIILTAYMIGDGCCGLSGNWALTHMPGPVTEEFSRLASRLETAGTTIKKKQGTDAITVDIHRDNLLIKWFDDDGISYKYAWEKFLPSWVFDLNESDTILFLSRLWATDGMIKGDRFPNISYGTTSHRLARDVRSLLSKLGILASITQREAGYTKDGIYNRCRDTFIVRVESRSGWEQFLTKIIVPGKPAIKPCEVEENNNRDTIPSEVSVWIDELAKVTSYKPINSLHAYGLRRKPCYQLSRAKLARYITYFKERVSPDHKLLIALRNLLDGDVVWDEIVSIEDSGLKETYDIEVENSHNFVLDGIVSHNSTSMAARMIVTSASMPYYSTLVVTPLFEMIRRFSHNYVRQFLETSPVRSLFSGTKQLNNVLQRTFKNGASIIFSYAFLDAERVRGISSDEVDIDELQDLNYDFLQIIFETLSGSPWGIKRYSGTPKSLDNSMQRVWDDSSQAEWMMKCLTPGCGHWNVPALSHDLYDMIGPWHRDISEECPGIVCSHCRKPINPRQGRWVHAFPDRRWSFAGYHVPQIIMPMHYANHEKWDTLVGKMQGRGNTTPTTFLNEVCAESCDSGAKLITETDLKLACILPWNRVAKEACTHIGKYTKRILSVDWGGGGGKLSSTAKKQGEQQRLRTSFTTLSVLGMCPDGKIDVLWGHRSLRTHDFEYEARLCLEAISLFKCSHIVHDYSNAGEGRLILLYQAGMPPSNIINMAYHGVKHNIMNFHESTDDNPHEWYSLDKSRSLVTTCMCIKYGLIRFFKYDYKSNDDAGLVRDFLALIEEKIDSRVGTDVYVIVRNPNLSDDFAQAVNYGCCALWWMTNKWPNVAEAAKMKIAPSVMKHIHPQQRIDWQDI